MAGEATTKKAAGTMSAEQAREEAAYTLGVQAYLWGVPITEYAKTGVSGLKARAVALNSFRKYPALKTAKDRFVVTPNNVTIDGYGVCDLKDEPAVIFVPKLTEDRWYIVQFGDYYDEIFHNIGGTKGQQPGVYIVTGPDFNGAIPGEMMQLRSRTRWAAAALRVFVKGEPDLPAAMEAQKGFHLMPLSAYLRHGLAYKPTESSMFALPPLPSAKAPANLRFFEELGHWMNFWLPASTDSSDALVNAFQQIGISTAIGFVWSTFDEPVKRGLSRAIEAGSQIVDAAWASTGETTNGWKYTLAGGRAGHDLALRAALAKYELGAQLSDQVIYPNCTIDDKNKLLDGANKYILHFEKGKQPAVSVFWNLAMYASDMLFVENDFGRYSIGSTTDGLKENPDGSLTLYIQNGKPDDTSNWLPAPAGQFNVTMRFYGPQPSILDGSYRLPPVTRQ